MLLRKSFTELEALGAGHTAKEIAQQPRLWHQILQELQHQKAEITEFLGPILEKSPKILFTGAGSSEFVGNTLVPYLKRLGIQNMHSVSSTDLVLSPFSCIAPSDEVLLISCARSGNSPESLAAAKLVEQVAADFCHIVLTCNGQGSLAQHYNRNSKSYILELPGANDQAFAMTGSFSSMVLIGSVLFQLERLDEFCQLAQAYSKSLAAYIEGIAPTIIEQATLKKTRIICLGSSEQKGIAQEAHLKVLELSASHHTASFDSPLGFRHGPKSILNGDCIVLFFLSADRYAHLYELDMLRELMQNPNGCQVVAICPHSGSLTTEKHWENLCLIRQPQNNQRTGKPHESIWDSLLHVLVAQLYALQNSLNLGVQPDNPSPSGMVNRVVQGVHIYPLQ